MMINNYEYLIDLARAFGAMAKEADMVCVVRCKDCKYLSIFKIDNKLCCLNKDGMLCFVQYDDYCSRGERKEGDTDDNTGSN